MTDIVERLHRHADLFEGDEGDLMRTAAAEIERLRAGCCGRSAEVPTAVLAEREACAKVADHYATMERLGLYGSVAVSEGESKIAAAIRARTEDR